MNFLRHIFGFALFLGIGVAGFILFKGATDQPVEAAVSESADVATSAEEADHNDAPDLPITAENKPTERNDATAVSVQVVNKQTLAPELTLYGSVETPRQSELSAAVSADVVTVDIFEGSSVQAGAILIKLNTEDLDLAVIQRRADVSEIEANIKSQQRSNQADIESLEKEQQLLELSRRSLDRAEKLASTRVGSEAAIDEAMRSVRQQELSLTSRQRAIDEHESTTAVLEARLARARAALRQAERDVGRALITAPFDGRVIEVDVSPGDRVRVGEKLLSIYDTQFVEARAQLPSRLVEQFRRNLNSDGSMQANGVVEGRSYTLDLDRLGGRIQSGSGSLDALFRFTDVDPPQLGRTITLTVKLPATSNAIALPNAAIRNGDRVYRVIENHLQSVPVTRIGEFRDENGQALIIVASDDIANDDRIITSQLTRAVDGMKVQVRQ